MSCTVEGCDKPIRKKGKWCCMHYSRWLRHGDVHITVKTPNGEAIRFLNDVVLKYEGSDCLIWPFARNPAGYGLFGRGNLVSRMACEEEHGPCRPKDEAAHSCGRGKDGCVSRKHLSWKTRVENEADKIAHGTTNRGQRSAHAKLTDSQARQIKSLAGKVTDTKLAIQFGVSQTTIREIRVGTRWAWLGEEAA